MKEEPSGYIAVVATDHVVESRSELRGNGEMQLAE